MRACNKRTDKKANADNNQPCKPHAFSAWDGTERDQLLKPTQTEGQFTCSTAPLSPPGERDKKINCHTAGDGSFHGSGTKLLP